MRIWVAIGLFVAGAVTGLATVAMHDVGWGLALAAAAALAAVVALPAGWWSRLAFVLGWDGSVGALTVPRPEGDYLVGADVPGYAVLGLGLVLLVLAIATLPRPRVSTRRGAAAS